MTSQQTDVSNLASITSIRSLDANFGVKTQLIGQCELSSLWYVQ